MKAAVFYDKHDIRIEEIKTPEPGPDDVLIRIMACGVCGTDVHIYEGDKGAAEVAPPIVLGHEFSGVVEAIGKNVIKFKPGEKVCVDPNVLCGRCYYCRSGLGHFCENMLGVGTIHGGGFAEFSCVPQKAVFHLADNTSFESGAMGEPVACCLHGIDMCAIRPGSVVVVFGAGMIGLIMVQLALLAGASRVAIVEPVAVKRNMGLKLGACLGIDPFKEDVALALKANGFNRVETVIECVGLPQTMSQAIDIAGNKSIVMMFGLTKPDDEISIKPFSIFRKEVDLKASFINPYTQERAVELINSGRIDVTSMMCDPIPLEKLVGALSDVEMRKLGKWVVKP